MILKPRLFSKPTVGHPLTRGLVGCWLFNEGGGDLAYDVSGNGNHGTLVGNAYMGAGKFGGALVLDGANDYGTIPAAAFDEVESANAFTFVAWVYNTDLTQDGCIMGQWTASNQFIFWMDTGTVDGYACIIQSADSGVTRTGESVASAVANVWQQVIATWDGNKLSVYVDGVLASSLVNARIIRPAALPIGIGSDSGNSASRSFPGIIDNVTIYNRVLSPDEVLSLYHDPFQMFKRDPLELWVGATSGGAAVGGNPWNYYAQTG